MRRHGINCFAEVLAMLFLVSLFSACANDDSTFEHAKRKNSFSSYSDYQKRYPQGIHREEAAFRKMLVHIRHEKTIGYFLEKYPDGDFADDARLELVKLSGDVNEYLSFIENNPNSNVVDEARSAAEEMLHEAAKLNPTINIYAKMAHYIPSGKYSAEAAAKLAELLKERDPLVADAQTLTYTLDLDMPYHHVDESGPRLVIMGNRVEDDFQKTIEHMAEVVGLRLIDDPSSSADLSLHVQARGEALAGDYMTLGKRLTGARIEGEIVLRKAGEVVGSTQFSGAKEPPAGFTYAGKGKFVHTKASEAPFDEAYSEAFPKTFIEFMERYFGRSVMYNERARVGMH